MTKQTTDAHEICIYRNCMFRRCDHHTKTSDVIQAEAAQRKFSKTFLRLGMSFTLNILLFFALPCLFLDLITLFVRVVYTKLQIKRWRLFTILLIHIAKYERGSDPE